jgi:transposase
MVHALRSLLRLAEGRNAQPSAAIFDSRTLQSTPESGERAGYDGHKRKQGSKVHMAVDTLGHLLALQATPANEQDRAQVAELAKQVQEETDEHVEVAFVDQGYTGEDAAKAAKQQGIRLEVVKLPEAKHGFVLLPRRWVVEPSFAWMSRFRRLAGKRGMRSACRAARSPGWSAPTRRSPPLVTIGRRGFRRASTRVSKGCVFPSAATTGCWDVGR